VAKKKSKKANKVEKDQARPDDGVAQSAATQAESGATQAEPGAKMKVKEYEGEMRRLHGELVAMQEWVKADRKSTRLNSSH
jgi:polyphosphate kinase 2 (PPK2 family)